MRLIILSLDSGTEAQCAALWNEVERTLGFAGDPLEELLREEDDPDFFDVDLALKLLNGMNRRVHGRGCSFPQCYQECAGCNSCVHRERSVR